MGINMKAVAVIPARGGSKRIPRKNIRPFLGKPVIAYSILAAQQAGVFDEIVVSTDDKEIAETAEHYGALVPFLRPVELSDDQTGIRKVVVHAIRELEEKNKYPSMVCTIYAASPLIQYQDIVKAYKKLQLSDQDFIFSATTFSATIFRAFSMKENGSIKMFWPENYLVNSQDFPQAYYHAGQFLWGRREAYLNESPQVPFEHSIAMIVPRYRVMDVDTLEDWRHAELLYKALQMADK